LDLRNLGYCHVFNVRKTEYGVNYLMLLLVKKKAELKLFAFRAVRWFMSEKVDNNKPMEEEDNLG